MKKRTFVCLMISLASLLLLSACGEKTVEHEPDAPVFAEKQEEQLDSGIKIVDVKDFVSVSFSGLDTFGVAEMSIDWNAMAEYVFGSDYTDNNLARLEAYIPIRPSKSSGLSNGDTFTVSVTDDFYYFDCELKESELVYTVSGLEEMETVDVFEDLAVTFEGIRPNGIAKVSHPSDDLFIQSITYEVSPSIYKLDEGDLITVRAVYSEETARRYGCVAETTERQYTVEGLGYYIEYPEEINDTCLRYMIEESYPVAKNLIKREFDDIISLMCPEGLPSDASMGYQISPVGNVYLFSPKENLSSKSHTVMIFEVSVYLTDADTFEEAIQSGAECLGTVYMGLEFTKLCIGSDGIADASGPVSSYDLAMFRAGSGITLSEREIYELYWEEYRDTHICYDPVIFDPDSL